MNDKIAFGLLIVFAVPLLSLWFYSSSVSLDRFNVLDSELERSIAQGEKNIPVVLWVDESNISVLQQSLTGQVFVQDFPVLKLTTDAVGVEALSRIQNVQKIQLDNQRALTSVYLEIENVKFTSIPNGKGKVKVAMIDTPIQSGTHGYYTYKTFRSVNTDAEVINIAGLNVNGQGSISQMLVALQEAVRSDPDLICASIGGVGQPNDVLSRTVNLIFARFGIPSVWSAGNEGLPSVYTPANARYAIASIALDDYGVRAVYSNYGDKDGRLMVSNTGHVVVDGRDEYGTSFSQPLLCGFLAHRIAVEKEKRGLGIGEHLSPDLIASIAINAAKNNDISETGWDETTGYGHPTLPYVMNAEASLGIEERLYIYPYTTIMVVNTMSLLIGGYMIYLGRKGK